MNKLEQLHWPLIVGMGSLALLWPFMNLTGLMETLGGPSGPVFILTLISAIWLAIVVFARVRQPFLTLLFTGLAYGVFVNLISAVFSSVDSGQPPSSLPRFVIVAAILIYGIGWGSVIGAIVWAIRRVIGAAGETRVS